MSAGYFKSPVKVASLVGRPEKREREQEEAPQKQPDSQEGVLNLQPGQKRDKQDEHARQGHHHNRVEAVCPGKQFAGRSAVSQLKAG